MFTKKEVDNYPAWLQSFWPESFIYDKPNIGGSSLSQQPNGHFYATRMAASTLNRRYHTPDHLKMAESPKSSKTSSNTSRPLSYCGMTVASKMFSPTINQMNDSVTDSGEHHHNKKPSNGRNWADVNNTISSRMIAAASDSPPIIPKRDYHYSPGNSHTAPRQAQNRQQTCDISTGEESDDTFTHRQHPNGIEYQSSHGGPNGSERGALMAYRPQGRFDPQADMIYGPPPPMGFMPPMGMGMPMGMFPPPPPMNFDPRGPPPFGMFPDQPGVLFTPFGPVHPGEMPDGTEGRGGGYNGKKKRRKEKLKRSRSLEFGGMFPPPPMMGPPPFGFPPPPPHMGLPMFPPMLGPPPPEMMMMMNAGGEHHGQMPMPFGHQSHPQPQSNSDGNSQTTVDGGAIVPYVPLGSSQTHLAYQPADKLPQKYDLTSRKSSKANGHLFEEAKRPEQKHSGCYLLCCKGVTQVIWIIIGIILIGVILGLVLGLTLV